MAATTSLRFLDVVGALDVQDPVEPAARASRRWYAMSGSRYVGSPVDFTSTRSCGRPMAENRSQTAPSFS